MLVSAPVVTLVTDSALKNLSVAATGAIVDLARVIALRRGLTTKILAKETMERVAVEVSVMVHAVLDFAVLGSGFVVRASCTVLDKMVDMLTMQRLTRLNKSSTGLLFRSISNLKWDSAVGLQRLTREAIASLNAPTMFNVRMEMNAGVYS
mmetsp:Transcript_1446/g.2168  ORF Transcript_1446/g.2168 Transcript_1446/m.2168 type:complete len:151 (+) Transcript_1446:857-1309(+)